MLKIIYRVCCGMDVHKSFIVACIASTNERGVTTYKSKRSFIFTRNLLECAVRLAESNSKDMCMEFTGGIGYSLNSRLIIISQLHP